MIYKQLTRLAVVALLFAGCGTAEKGKHIEITNHAAIERTDELVVLTRETLAQQLGPIADGKYVSIQSPQGIPQVVQLDDVNGDGRWDEAAFLYTFKPEETASFAVAITDNPAAVKAVVRAHVRHRKKNVDNTFAPAIDKDTMPVAQPATDFSKQPLPPYLTEGPAWENDKVGFRIYFDVRNGKDIWGKTTPQMMMDEVGADTAHNYHLQADWGMDVLKVGPSLGAGSLALSVPFNGKDTLVRLGGKNIGQVTYAKIADGPVRAIFRLQYKDWKVADSMPPVTVTETISIWGGQYFYQSDVTVSGAPANTKLVTGMVNFYSHQSYILDTAQCKAMYTYDVQSENHDKLGMSIVTKDKQFSSFSATPNAGTDVQNTYTTAFNVADNTPVSFRFYAAWERSDQQFTTAEGFSRYLQYEMLKLGEPVTVKWF